MIASERPASVAATSDEEVEWLRRLERDLALASGGELGFREAVARRGRWLLARRRSIERAVRASEPWALAELEWVAGHRARALARVDDALALLREVPPSVLRRAVDLVAAAVAHELAAGRAGALATMCNRALAACDARDVPAKLRCLCALASVHAHTGASASLVATCEDGLAIVRSQLAIDVHGDPYRDGRPRFREGAPHERAAVVALSIHAALARADQGEFDQAEHVLERARALLGATPPVHERVRLALTAGRIARMEGRLPAALRLFAVALDGCDDRGSEIEARVGMAWTYFELELVERAAEVAGEIVRLDAPHAGAADLLARIELCRADLRAAEHWARRALADRSSPVAHVAGGLRTLAEIHLARGELGEARVAARDALARLVDAFGADAPETVDARLTLARVETAFGAETAAEECLARALAARVPEDHPRLVPLLLALAELRQGGGWDVEAESLRERARAIRRRTMRAIDAG
jgi:tetratricopeptide (TPR) repeat protein